MVLEAYVNKKSMGQSVNPFTSSTSQDETEVTQDYFFVTSATLEVELERDFELTETDTPKVESHLPSSACIHLPPEKHRARRSTQTSNSGVILFLTSQVL